MTNEERVRIEEIKARCEAATQGKWTVYLWGLLDNQGKKMLQSYSDDAMFDRIEDAEFCAHAKEDISKLLEMVERQQWVIGCYNERLIKIHDIADGIRKMENSIQNAPKMDNNLDNKLDNKLDNDRDVKIG